ncbi:MAG: TldD/PmbA family protein [Bacteroidales bacterium]|nr:TldD/PmbA family protein [Bacteroidales bacterium]
MLQKYLDLFQTDRAQMERIVATALGEGGDWCDLYFEDTIYNDLLLKDSEVTSGGFAVDCGVGIRVLKDERTGYAYSESTGMADMLAAAKAASVIARGGGAKTVKISDGGTDLNQTGGRSNQAVADVGTNLDCQAGSYGYQRTNGRVANNFYPITDNNLSHKAMLPYFDRLEAAIRAKDSRVVKVIAKLSDSLSRIMMYNSLGELTADTRPLCSLAVSVIFAQNGAMESKNASRSFRMGLEMITDSLIEELAAEATSGIDERFEARRPKGGKMPVVMSAGASGILLHEAMGHAFEADFNRKGQSIFSDKMGQRVCACGISIVDDATIPYNRGSLNIDDEGVPGRKTYMVRDGILTSYLHDRISAAHYGVAPTGNGRRENFRCNPIPRMRATYMEAGAANPADIIASVRKGLYVDEFSNGQVKIGEGDFTFFVKSGHLIENGRLTMPVKDINVIGNGPRALADITAVGSDLLIDNGTWTCGKEQSAAVSLGIPTVLVSSLTVGGE